MPKTTKQSTKQSVQVKQPALGEQPASPVGSTHREGISRRARSGVTYREELRRLVPYEGLARLVIARRQALELTQQELAELVGTSHSAISRIESGRHAISVSTLRRLAVAFETHLVVGFDDAPETMSDRELVAIC